MNKKTIVVRIDKDLFDKVKKWGVKQTPPIYKDKPAIEAACKKGIKP